MLDNFKIYRRQNHNQKPLATNIQLFDKKRIHIGLTPSYFSPLITMENGNSMPIKKSNGVVEGGSFDQVRKKTNFHPLTICSSDFGLGRLGGFEQGGEITRDAQVSKQFYK